MLGSVVRTAAELVLQAVFPPTCVKCGEGLFGQVEAFVCSSCENELCWIGEGACRLCSAPAGAHANLGKGCAQCRPHALRFTRAAAVMSYRSPAREVIHAFKFHDHRRLARPLADLMVKRLVEVDFPSHFDCVMPVPLHADRLRERGYNQAHLLAARVAEKLSLPLRLDILKRVRATDPQALLGPMQRHTNPVGAFAAGPHQAGRSVLLVDDVLTTGTTVSECAVVLRAAGWERIYVVVVAR